MKTRSVTALAVAALGASIAGAQARLDAGGGQHRPYAAVQQTFRSNPIDTRRFFPQVSRIIQQRPFEVENRSRRMPHRTGPVLRNTTTGVTNAPGPRALPKFLGVGWTSISPADPDLAAGPNHLVQVVNSQIAFFSKTGSVQYQQSASTFFSGVASSSGQLDPRVIYDRASGRFVLIFLERAEGGTNASNLLFAISDDSNPHGTWFRYRFNVVATAGGRDYYLDYPGFGYNREGYVICGNLLEFGGGGSIGSEFVVVPKAPVLAGDPVTVTRLFDATYFDAQMAETVGSDSAAVYGAAMQTATSLGVFAVTGIDGGTPSLTSTSVPVPNSPWPRAAASVDGTLLDTRGSRIVTAVWRGGSLYLANSYDVSMFDDLVGIRWYEIGTGDWPKSGGVSLKQTGTYTSSEFNYFLPAINVNAHNDVSMLFTRSSLTTAADIVVAGRVSGDAPGTMGAPTTLASSNGKYVRFRWGDYFGVDVDPVDDETFWGTAMAISSDGNWTTHVVSWTVSRTERVVPSSGVWTRGFLQSGGLASLGADDGDYCVARAGLALFLGEPPAQLVVESVAPAGNALELELSVVSKVDTPGLGQRIELWNYASGAWDSAGEQVATVSDSLHVAVAVGAASEYVEPGTRAVRARVVWFRTGLTLVWPWTVSVDQVEWSVRTR